MDDHAGGWLVVLRYAALLEPKELGVEVQLAVEDG